MNKRQREVIQHGLNSEEEVLEALKETYKKALEDVEKEIKLLTVDDAIQSKIFRKEYQEQLKQQISSVLDAMNSGQFKTIDEYVKACYTDSFIGTMYDIAGQGVPLIIPIDQNQLIRAVSLNSKLSKSLYESLGENVDDLKKTVTQEISRGIATASNWRDIARSISYNMMGDYSQTRGSMAYAYRIARTEGHRIQNEAALHAQKEAKKKGADVVKQWDATLDGATRPNHRLLDGQIRELDEMFSVPGMSADAPGCSGIAAEDVNCRCTLLQRARWALDEEELETLKERAEYYGLSEEKANTFEEYEKNYLKAVDKGADSGGVRSSAQKINDEKTLDNNGNSAIIKSITVENVREAVEGSSINPEVAEYVSSVLSEKKAMNLYDKVITVSVDSGIVMNTNAVQAGTFADVVLELNVNALGGKTVEEIDLMFINAKNTVANSFEEAIAHEKYHADLIRGMNFAQIESLYDELNSVHIESLSEIAYKDGAECIAEVGVLIDRGEADSIPEDAMKLFVKYMGHR